MMTKEYKVMMKINGKWLSAGNNCRRAKITATYEEAISVMNRVAERRLKTGHPADEYKIISREVGEWKDE